MRRLVSTAAVITGITLVWGCSTFSSSPSTAPAPDLEAGLADGAPSDAGLEELADGGPDADINTLGTFDFESTSGGCQGWIGSLATATRTAGGHDGSAGYCLVCATSAGTVFITHKFTVWTTGDYELDGFVEADSNTDGKLWTVELDPGSSGTKQIGQGTITSTWAPFQGIFVGAVAGTELEVRIALSVVNNNDCMRVDDIVLFRQH
jgi:hypothetical protein